MEYLFMMLFGICITFLGIFNYKGNISSIHWYNRIRVVKTKEYGKVMGLGTIIVGLSITLTAVLQFIFDLDSLYIILSIGIIVGLAIMIYGQFKYNKGIF